MVGIFDLHDFIERDILPEIAGGLDGRGGGLINIIPTEMDCNAAARSAFAYVHRAIARPSSVTRAARFLWSTALDRHACAIDRGSRYRQRALTSPPVLASGAVGEAPRIDDVVIGQRTCTTCPWTRVKFCAR